MKQEAIRLVFRKIFLVWFIGMDTKDVCVLQTKTEVGFSIVLAFCFGFASCNESVDWRDYSPTSFNVERYHPITKKGYPVPFETYEKISNQLNLYSIENGFDSFQLRISIVDSFGPIDEAGDIVMISCNKNRIWKASCTRYDVAVVDSGVRMNAKSVESLSPKSWSDVSRKIGALSIGSWLGASSFAYDDYRVGHTDHMIRVEYASTTQWRRMIYVSPSAVTCILPECKKLEALLQIIIDEFGVVEFEKYL